MVVDAGGVNGLGGGVGVPDTGKSKTGAGEGDAVGVQTLTGVMGVVGRAGVGTLCGIAGPAVIHEDKLDCSVFEGMFGVGDRLPIDEVL